MLAGKLRHRVELQSAAEEQDTFGESIPTWSTYATVWASVNPLAGREAEQAKQVAAEADHRINLRYRSGVTTEHRAKFGSRIFEISSVLNPEERNLELVLLCTEAL